MIYLLYRIPIQFSCSVRAVLNQLHLHLPALIMDQVCVMFNISCSEFKWNKYILSIFCMRSQQINFLYFVADDLEKSLFFNAEMIMRQKSEERCRTEFKFLPRDFYLKFEKISNSTFNCMLSPLWPSSVEMKYTAILESSRAMDQVNWFKFDRTSLCYVTRGWPTTHISGYIRQVLIMLNSKWVFYKGCFIKKGEKGREVMIL